MNIANIDRIESSLSNINCLNHGKLILNASLFFVQVNADINDQINVHQTHCFQFTEVIMSIDMALWTHRLYCVICTLLNDEPNFYIIETLDIKPYKFNYIITWNPFRLQYININWLFYSEHGHCAMRIETNTHKKKHQHQYKWNRF